MLIALTGQVGAGLYARVDKDDYERLMKYTWYCKEGYALAKINGVETRMHRLVMNVSDPLQIVDHINRNRLDNRKQNLRLYTAEQNSNNRENNVFIECFGETKTIAEWAKDDRCPVSYDILQKRIQSGYEYWAAILSRS